MSHKSHIADLHFEHQIWKKEFLFFKEEVTSFENRLNEIVVRYTDKDVLAHLEHLQNSFILQRNAIDELKHKVGEWEHKISKLAEAHPVASDRILIDDHTSLRDEILTFKKIYQELKHDFLTFTSKWM